VRVVVARGDELRYAGYVVDGPLSVPVARRLGEALAVLVGGDPEAAG
jgi:hypothetical protein